MSHRWEGWCEEGSDGVVGGLLSLVVGEAWRGVEGGPSDAC